MLNNETCIFLEFSNFFVYAKEMKCKPLIPTPYLNNTLSPMYRIKTKGKEEETHNDSIVVVG